MLKGILLQTPAPAPAGGGWIQQLLLFGGIAVVFYFFMIRPQQKKQKDQKSFISDIKKGDRIVTIGGIHGRIAEMDDDTITLDVEKGAKIKFDKSAISLEASKKLAGKA
ncbi:preprotein translocase subunit YajC [Roseivirga sp.]|uniref:preprotein translocase subunit YajC n=1 Tax=Roseivirga sp. TaxID=1964215 RepID=UPI002B270899|nr:preprotein translocase subunit YajC [Roseivirga sp.]